MCLGLAAGYIKPKHQQAPREMTAAEAAKRIVEHNRIHRKKEPNAYYITNALNLAVEALNKQTPQKAISFEATSEIKIGAGTWGVGTTVYKCPCCDSFITRSSDFCSKCGKAIDWRCKNVQTD